jgi:hypothetical protein
MDEMQLRERIRAVLTLVRDTLQTVHAQPAAQVGYAPEPPLLRIVSPLAEGADRLVAEVGLELGYELHCPLPFARDDYAQDFTTDTARQHYYELLGQASRVLEFNGSRTSPLQENSAYQAVGRLVLRQCDVLITIWDGESAQQEQGGTYQVIDEAARLGLNIVWIRAQAPHEICLLAHNPRGLDCTAPLEALPARLQTLLQPPASTGLELCQAYGNDRRPSRNLLGNFYQIVSRLLTGGVADSLPLRQAPDLPATVTKQIETCFLKYYHWADQLAADYAGRYRGAFTLCYLLSGCAVLMAMLSYIFHLGFPDGFIITELAIIMLIMGIVWNGRRNRWHDGWISYRLLAEQLRQMRFLAPLGCIPPAFHHPTFNSDDPGLSWVNWQFRTILREAGLLQACIDQTYLDVYRQRLTDYEILTQSDYHRHTAAARSEIIKERLHRLGYGLFIATLIVCIIHLICYDNQVNRWLAMLAAVLPAFGAAFAGILGHGEFARIARRSEAIHKRLDELRQSNISADYSELTWLAEQAADVMLSEVLDWHVVFRLKPLDLPA